MTVADVLPPSTPAEHLTVQLADLLRRVHAVLDGHPAGHAVRLMYTPEEIWLGPGRGAGTDREPRPAHHHAHPPRPLDRLGPDDDLHELHVLNPGDQEFTEHIAHPVASDCRVNVLGNHAYPTLDA